MDKILVVEDDEHVGNMLEELLSPAYRVARAYSGTEALLVLEAEAPDLVLLDLMLPGANGEDILEKILPVPVIIVSAKPDPEQKADLLLRGASDYISKPFYPKELLARIAVQLRQHSSRVSAMTHAGVQLDQDLLVAKGPVSDVHLTRTEAAILKLFLADPQRVYSKSMILDRISADTPDCTESSLKMHISNIRRKLRETGAPDPYIESVWGIGFRLCSDPDQQT